MSPTGTAALALTAALITACFSGRVALRGSTTLRVGPSGGNPCHSEGVKLLAGAVPVWVALASCAVAVRWSWSTAFVLLFTLGMSIVGYIDDRKPFDPLGKLLAQGLPLAIGALTLPSLFGRSWFCSLPIWFVALLVSSNAMNVLDVADGLAPGAATMTLGGTALITLQQGQNELSRIALIFGGCSAVFLIFNAAPARLILGDTGSLALGGLCALLAAHCVPHEPWGIVILPLLLFIPSLEVCWLSVHRVRRGIAPWRASPHHLVYWLAAKGYSTSGAASALVLTHTLAVGVAVWLLGCAHAMSWLIASVLAQLVLFWGKNKWSKRPRHQVRIHASP